MSDVAYLLFFAVYWFAAAGAVVPAWISVLITGIHTVEETHGKIWDALGISAAGYFLFQFFVTVLGLVAAENGGGFAVAFVAVRLFDVLVTHILLRKVGQVTAALLLVDAGWHAWLLVVG